MMYFNRQVWGDKLNRNTPNGVVYGTVQIGNDQVILAKMWKWLSEGNSQSFLQN